MKGEGVADPIRLRSSLRPIAEVTSLLPGPCSVPLQLIINRRDFFSAQVLSCFLLLAVIESGVTFFD